MKIGKSQHFKEEYCASIVRIGETYPIEGRDRIVKTFVNGMPVVIGKNEFKTGDVVVYCANETALNKDFVRVNSMFEDKELNDDKEKKGYINKHGRIRVVKLGGVLSYGLLLHPRSFPNYLKTRGIWCDVQYVKAYLEQHVGADFDEIEGERFCQVYIPPRKEVKSHAKGNKRNSRLKKFRMLIDGSFHFHYDTKQLAKEINNFYPEDWVDISVKIHGTSAIFANILTNVPTNWFKRKWRKYILRKPEYDQRYNLVYSSRGVIKNEFINPKAKDKSFYSDDIWGYWAKKLDGLIPEGTCIYCEIAGFTPNGSAIQKNYDYGCLPTDENKSVLMVYRMTKEGHECEISDVINFGNDLSKLFGKEIMKFPLLYHGELGELYPDLDVSSHWHENLLERLRTDKRFCMEKNEPLCINSVPREGIVLRKCSDPFPMPEAFKLKTNAYMLREAKAMDAGEIDMEMSETY